MGVRTSNMKMATETISSAMPQAIDEKVSIINDVSLTYHEERLCMRLLGSLSGHQWLILTLPVVVLCHCPPLNMTRCDRQHIMNRICQQEQQPAHTLFIYLAAHTKPMPMANAKSLLFFIIFRFALKLSRSTSTSRTFV